MYLNKVEICGINTATLKVLKEKEKIELLTRIKNNDRPEQAREKLISGNLKLVLSVIQRFTNRGENLDDLFQVGCIGLIKAIDNFDISQNVRFSTYAVPMIIGEIRRYLRDNNSVRVSRSLKDTAYKAMQAKEKLTTAHLKEPTIDENRLLTPSRSTSPFIRTAETRSMSWIKLGINPTTKTGWMKSPSKKPSKTSMSGRKKYFPSAFLMARPKSKWLRTSGSPKRRSLDSKRARLTASRNRSNVAANVPT